ncbi:HelD family protein [Cohnella thailandensis]|uniref:DNA 3'-5' helicase n=1 Tax=Cohnella thailandensis TaxID=557557 RepID=A0A841T1T0_9BACL|nr:3'-5' exonuclease [Cohnella thailandensis]MBB6637009.1 ATP-binding domain-containing protein [Cohnella thailandensis]MBP1973107.1 DNA helicase-2/ATP-dependent DNA helicase PcrA [Cohnella thailandensis]
MSANAKFQEETLKLEKVLGEIQAQRKAIGAPYTGQDIAEQVLDDLRQQRKKRLEIAEREPYFGRLDFQEEGHSEAQPLYIGKSGVGDEETQKPLVIDWRAPISSLFYSFTGGDPSVTYDSPDGIVNGRVSLKRNLLIRESELQRVVDSYEEGQGGEALATDEFLLHRLGESKDNKLKDIVSTIQQEQDAIIRTEKNKALFIQGVAGSGKTTVALHRLAYLLYRYKDRVRAERMMILAPSRMFLDYISGVLPELGVGDIRQTTFEEWALELLGGTVVPESPASSLEKWFERKASKEERESAPGRVKGSAAYVGRLREALARFEEKLIPDDTFSPAAGVELQADRIREWFREEPSDEPVMKRRERLLNRLKRWMEIQLGRARWSDKTIKAAAMAKWKSYSGKIPPLSAAEFYRAYFPDEATYRPAASKRKPIVIPPEDLPILAYIHLQLYGSAEPAYDHIVIDEAQDYSPLQLAVLAGRQRIPSLTVLGDLQQGIHDYAGIRSWTELSDLFAKDDTAYYELDRSYRSTTEIIEFANRILSGMEGEVKPAVPVFRSGDPVETVAVEASSSALAKEIASTIQAWSGGTGISTIAVLCRTAAKSKLLHAELQKAGVEASLLQADQQAYHGGITVLPSYLSKGLEFDAVILADADRESYAAEDAKLLYVACTRALHRLKVLYQGEPSALIV